MSRPLNPLSKFRSYSYYHVLAICDSTATADLLADETKAEKWLHPTGPAGIGSEKNRENLGPFSVRFMDEKKASGRFCILINGATDSRYTIVKANWVSATAAGRSPAPTHCRRK